MVLPIPSLNLIIDNNRRKMKLQKIRTFNNRIIILGQVINRNLNLIIKIMSSRHKKIKTLSFKISVISVTLEKLHRQVKSKLTLIFSLEIIHRIVKVIFVMKVI